MKKRTTKWLESEKICIAHGQASAKNLMFETKKDHQLFLQYWEKYLGGMVELINYHLSKTGWGMLFKTRSEYEIQEAYRIQRKQSRKAKKSKELTDVGRILSEHVRIFLSQYVRRTNSSSGREGGKVKSRFKKYIVTDVKEYEKIFQSMMNQEEIPSQKRTRYQADESEYDEGKEMSEDSVWKVGYRIYMGLDRYDKVLKNMCLLLPLCDVLRKYLKSSNLSKILSISTHSP